ncbi:MAG: hypothetical protein JST82_13520 [Bacteroidetes bacterium]|nr:hypothetical protein [Bacteroidota bacterium]
MTTDFGWNIRYNNRNFLIADSDWDINGVGNQITVLFEDNHILVNVIKKTFRGVRLPLLIDDWDTTNDIRKYITENAPQ